MSSAAVFVVAFLAIFGLSLVFPELPPAQIIQDFLNLPGLSFSIFGISLNLVNSILNGIIWGGLILLIYGLGRFVSRSKPLPPMPAPKHIPTPPPTPMPVKSRMERLRFRIIERKTYVSLNQDIEVIEGIGPIYGSRLRNVGVRVIADLLREGSTRTRRRYLANKIGVAPATLFKWVCRADFFRIRGIGKQYSALLESAGVRTIENLSIQNPLYLYAKLGDLNSEKNLVRRTPTLKMVRGWIRSAKNLKSTVMY